VYHYGEINNLQNIFPGLPEGSTLLVFNDHEGNPLADSPGAVLTVYREGQQNQEYRGSWVEIEDYRGTDLHFSGFDGIYGSITYENGDVYTGHFQEDENIYEILNPQLGDTCTRGGNVYTYRVNNADEDQPWIPAFLDNDGNLLADFPGE